MSKLIRYGLMACLTYVVNDVRQFNAMYDDEITLINLRNDCERFIHLEQTLTQLNEKPVYYKFINSQRIELIQEKYSHLLNIYSNKLPCEDNKIKHSD